MSSRLPLRLLRNPVALTGTAIAVMAAVFMLTFLLFDLATGGRNPYLGLFTFLIFPGVMTLGLMVALVGVLVSRWRGKRRAPAIDEVIAYPRLDLNLPSHRRAVAAVGVGVAIALPVVGLLSYEGYHYTDSNQFCGQVCHSVMQPQYTAYLQSPHARVHCVDCHIGGGATWYVKSKLSGARQVLAVLTNTYSRPIPPAITELRPAVETCQQCHWPAKFFGDQLRTVDHFASDEANTHRRVMMLVKTGGNDPSTGPPSGIHWHMALGHTVEYVAVDAKLQDIPWVRITDHQTGSSKVFRSDGLSADVPPPAGTRRSVDCMDCHNRPTHIFRSPDRAADAVFVVQPDLRTLPHAKRQLVTAVTGTYATRSQGLAQVPERVRDVYRGQYPTVWAQHRADVDRLAEAARGIYDVSVFPFMNVTWRAYPDNIGHMAFPGCFRCHDGGHVDAKGKTITRDCKTCHEFLAREEGSEGMAALHVTDFVHPVTLEGVHATMRCDRCHTGGPAPSPTCAGCHATQAQFIRGDLEELRAFAIAPDPMADGVECQQCHDLSKPATVEAIGAACTACHDETYQDMLKSWRQEVEPRLVGIDKRTDAEGRRVLDLLRHAGPLHNIQATRNILQSLEARASNPAR